MNEPGDVNLSSQKSDDVRVPFTSGLGVGYESREGRRLIEGFSTQLSPPIKIMPSESAVVLDNARKLVRELLLTSFEVGSLSHIRDLEPVARSALESFDSDPELTPSLSGAQLDLSGETLISLKESSWNQSLIYQLARRAQAMAEHSENHEQYELPNEDIHWDNLCKDRIHRILREIHQQRTMNSDISSASAKRQHSVRTWFQKLNRRQKIAVLAEQACQEKGDIEGKESWGFLLYAVGSLQVDGMSDEEDGEEDGNPVRLVLDVAFRRKEFRPLFRFIDSDKAGIEKGQGGRKFRKRVEISKVSHTQRVPSNIRDAFLSPDYRNHGYQEVTEEEVEVHFSK
ncbi:hypothetical protein C8R42DRAFT_645832 [Lentinula raphanica]|nr:hypothetical protein C8R42DRAFT_645832 [Lentinula raphanica]